VITPAAMAAWGWRVPFLLGGVLGPVGLYMRRAVDETPAYAAAVARGRPARRLPPGALRLAGRAFGFTIVWTVSYYTLLNYMPTWAQDFMHLSASRALWANTLGLVVLLAAIPVMGRLSDRIGRKPLLLACCVGFVVAPWPVFHLLLVRGPALGLLIVVQVGFALLIAMFSGPGPAAISEIFVTSSRSTLMTTGYSFAVAIFGGFAPFISVWLIEHFGSPTVHSFYLMAAALASTLVIAAMPETAFQELR
jgi:MHS family proline/betaine transporter-like MFS transporter